MAKLTPEDLDKIAARMRRQTLCSREPMMTVEIKDQAPVKYADLDEEKTAKVFSDHVLGGNIVVEYALGIGSERTS